MRYENIIKDVCGENWASVNEEERFGGLGVACYLSYNKGVNPEIEDVARHLGLDEWDIEIPFYRLKRKGVFSNSKEHYSGWGLKKNKKLDTNDNETVMFLAHIAGLSSGFIS